MNIIKDSWEEFVKSGMPKNSSTTYIDDMRCAFYAGAANLFATLFVRVEDPTVTNEQGADFLAGIQQEISDYLLGILDGHGKPNI